MPKQILIDAVYPDETRVVICNNRRVEEFDYETAVKKQLKGNIYLAKVTRVEPSLQAAFVDYGGDKHGFLPFSEIHPDYYHLPLSDRDVAATLPEGEAATVQAENIGLHIRSITPPDLSADDNEEDDPLSVVATTAEAVALEDAIENQESNTTSEDVDEASATPVAISSDDDSDDDIDSIATDTEEDTLHDEASEAAPKRSQLYRQYKIQEVIKRNQIILVQVIKEERGNKGVSLTSYISLAGRYCVLMPNSERQGGISKRIAAMEDRKRLKTIIESLDLPDGTSVIVRTAGQGRGKAEIKRDYDYLVRLWNSIREHTLSSKAPAFIHAEGDLIKRSIRDMYDTGTDEILIQGEKAYRSAKDFMTMIMPSHAGKVKQYKNKVPIFSRYQVDEQLSSLYSPIATLDSGGYIVINPTEALISIDVNSGRSTSERNIEETATKTNLEAAAEIARQLRLRDLSGLIVIDFIDMSEQRNRRAVERALKEALEADRAKIQIGRISLFGLLEMSRQRLRSSFVEANMVSCPHCAGRGIIRAAESTAVMALRVIESEVYKGDSEAINMYAAADTVMYILNAKRKELAAIEERYDVRIMLFHDPHANADSFSTEKVKRITTPKTETTSMTTLEPYTLEGEEENDTPPPVRQEERKQEERKKNWRRTGSANSTKAGGRSRRAVAPQAAEADPVATSDAAEQPTEAAAATVPAAGNNGTAKRTSRRRSSRRGGKRNAQQMTEKQEEATIPAENIPVLAADHSDIVAIPTEVLASADEQKPASGRRRYRYGRGQNKAGAAAVEAKVETREDVPAPRSEPESLLKELWKRIID